MKKLAAMVTAALMIAMAGVAMADTASVNVTATVLGTCRFDTTPSLDFGTLDQTSNNEAQATGDLTFWCTRGANYTLSDDKGGSNGSLDGSLADGGNSIAYTLEYTPYSGVGNGKTSSITSMLTARIANADYVDAPAGTYQDTVIFTINP